MSTVRAGEAGQAAGSLAAFAREAYQAAPAVRELFDSAGVDPDSLHTPEDLSRIPVTKKEKLLEMQRATPPFGGLLATGIERLSHVYVSPGPLYDPQDREDVGLGFRRVFEAAGIGPGDLVLNTWSYHLVPAGMAFDEALTAVGATVIPAGIGNTELQAQVVVELGVTVVVASTAFFVTLAEKLVETGHELPRGWKVRIAFLGGEPGDWYGRRQRLEERFGLRTVSAYGTGELGMIGWECGAEPGYHILENRLVQICEPISGQPLPQGEVGEVVVTALNPIYPLIRFGTGDAACLLGPCPCGRPGARLSPLTGRVGDAVKVREIFIYPRHLEEISTSVAGVARAQAVVTRAGHRDQLTVRIEVRSGFDPDGVSESARSAFNTLCRLRADAVEVVTPDGLDGQPAISDQRVL